MGEVIREIDEALDKGLARFLINTQSKLSAASPLKTGRLASSWFIGKVPDERRQKWQRVGDHHQAGLQDHDGCRPLDQQLIAERAAFDPYNGRRGGGDWFRIENNLTRDAEKAFDYF